jgi:hypothetical protein
VTAAHYRIKEHKQERTRENICAFCLKPHQQYTAILEDADGERIIWLPKFCVICTRRTMRSTDD